MRKRWIQAMFAGVFCLFLLLGGAAMPARAEESSARDYAAAHGIQAGVVLGGTKIITDDMARLILGLDESVEVTERFYK